MRLQIRRAVCDNGISRGVALVKGIFRELAHRIKYLFGDFARVSVCQSARNKAFALLFHYLRLFLCHCAADYIGVTVGIPRHNSADLHDLLLIKHHSAGCSEYPAQAGRGVFRPLRVGTVFKECVDRHCRPRAVKRYHGDDILQIARL